MVAVSGQFKIDRASPLPVYAQLADQIRLLVRRGALSPGDPLPTVRELAVALGINANTVTRVYRDLQQEGLLRLERGLGTFVQALQREPTLVDRDYQRIVKRTRSWWRSVESPGSQRASSRNSWTVSGRRPIVKGRGNPIANLIVLATAILRIS
jgi:DNA-binding transcriptional regulator YhcF (GntR family)